MPHVLTNEELNALCLDLKEQAQLYNVHMGQHLLMLYNTGCRVAELNSFSRLTLTGTGSVGLITVKSNYIRVLDSSFIAPLYYNRLINGIMVEYSVSPLMVVRFIRNRLPYTKVMNGEKECVAHLFRHNRCRTLYAAGWSKAQIGTFMGQMATSTVDNYLFDNLVAYP